MLAVIPRRIYCDAFDDGDAWIHARPVTWVGAWPAAGQALVPVPGPPAT